jgi:hypothetical protein
MYCHQLRDPFLLPLRQAFHGTLPIEIRSHSIEGTVAMTP